MSDQQMPARIWVGYNTGWADCEMRGDTAYVKADIAERMAEALEELLGSPSLLLGLREKNALDARWQRANAALSAFKDSAKDGSAS